MDVTARPTESQGDKFREAARAAECDPDEARWDAKLKRVAKQRPAPGKPAE